MEPITYTLVGDYLLPNLVLPESEHKQLGLCAQLHKRYLQEHRPALYCELLLSGKLYSHLCEIDLAASVRSAAGASSKSVLEELVYVR